MLLRPNLQLILKIKLKHIPKQKIKQLSNKHGSCSVNSWKIDVSYFVNAVNAIWENKNTSVSLCVCVCVCVCVSETI